MNSKRILSMVLSMVLLFSNVLAAPIITVVDMPTGWSQPAVTEAVENGILTVENGEIRPMEPLTRAEMAEGITNAFGATEKASLSAYTDVPATKWYYEAMQKAVAMGIISGYGNGLIKPEKKITREEMFTVIYNALELEDGNLYFLNKFNDKNLVSDWAKFIVARMVQNNFVSGNAKGNIKPTESITREEFAQVMKNIFAEYYNVPGTYTNIPAGNIIVSTPNVTLKDATVTGDLIIADGVGIGEVTLDNVTVLGRTIVRGGGENSIKLINNTTLNGNLIINNNISRVRIYNQKSQVKNLEVRTPAILEGDFENVKVTKSTQVETKGNINKITVDEKSDVMVTSGTVEQIDVKNTAAATVISGKGKVTQVNANANDVTVSTSKTQVTAASNVTGVVAGKVAVEAGKTATVKSSSGGGGGGGGGGSSSGGGGGGSSSSKVTIPTLKLTDIENGGKIDLGANYGKFEVSYVYEDGYQTNWCTPTAKVLTESDNDATKGWTSKTTIVKVKYGTSEKQLTIRPATPSFNVSYEDYAIKVDGDYTKYEWANSSDNNIWHTFSDTKECFAFRDEIKVRLKGTEDKLPSCTVNVIFEYNFDKVEFDEEAIADVLNLGIMGYDANGKFNPEENITRAEMSKIIAKLVGLTENQAEANKDYESNFSDVAAGEWYTGWINLVAGRGLVTCFEDGTFKPNEKATEIEFITALVKALGWGEVVENASGDSIDTKYIAKASELKLFDNGVVANDEFMLRGNAAIYAHNALDAKTWSIGEENSATLREKYFEGKVGQLQKEGFITAFNPTNKIIELEELAYSLAETVQVKIFDYEVGVGVDAILTILGASELNCINENGDLTRNIKVNAVIEDNKISVISFEFSDNGYVSTVDSKLKINEFFVEKITSKGKITVAGSSYYDELDYYTEDNSLVVRNGKTVTAKDIEVGDVVTEVIYGDEVKLMYASENNISGTISGYHTNSNIVTVNNESYKVIDAPFYNIDGEIDKCIVSTAEEIFDIFYGEEAEMYLNMVGEVVAVVGEIQLPQTVGVVSSVGDIEIDDETDEQCLSIRILAEDGTNLKYKILGNSKTDISTLAISEGAVVTFIANANNVIEVDKLKLITAEETDINTKMASDVDIKIAEQLVSDKENKTINGYEVNSKTIIINAKEKELITWDALVNKESDTVKIVDGTKAYLFVNENTAVYIVVCMDGDNYGNIEENYGILLDTRKDKDEDAETIYIATMMVNGREVKYECTAEFVAAVNVGDFISFTAHEGVIHKYGQEYVNGEEIIDYIDNLTTDEINLASYTNLATDTSLKALTVELVEVIGDDTVITFADKSYKDLVEGYIVYNLPEMKQVVGINEGDYVLVVDRNTAGEYGIVIVLKGEYEEVSIPTFAESDTWYKGETKKEDLSKIVFTNTGNRTLSGDEIEYWNADVEDNGEIFCYIVDDVLYIDGNGNAQNKIYANEDASYMFYGFGGYTEELEEEYRHNVFGIENIENIGMLDTSNVTNMEWMFAGCYALKELDVSKFVTSNVKSMTFMFDECESLTKLDVSDFKTSNVTNMEWMFAGCSALKELDVSKFDTSNVTDMSSMFWGCELVTELDVSNFVTSNVTDMSEMFSECNELTELDVSKFDTSNVTDMSDMFDFCYSLTELDVSKFDTSNVTNMSDMFGECSSLTKLDVSKLDTGNVTDMSDMFAYCDSLTELDVSKFDTSNVTDMNDMFDFCSSLTELDVSKFDTSNVTDMSEMFRFCSSLTELDVSKFDTSNVTDMSGMFEFCSSLIELDVSKFDTSNVTDMSGMFAYCDSLTELYLSNFNTSNVTDMQRMFRDCNNLELIKIEEDFAFIGEDHGFTSPQSYYIEGADGKWYDENGTGHTVESVIAMHSGENRKSATYYAVNPKPSIISKYIVTDYGAMGNGINDDTVAINATIDEAPDGATIYFPAGTYLVSEANDFAAIRIIGRNDLTLEFENGATIKHAPTESARYYSTFV